MCTHIRALPFAELHAATDVQALAIGKLEGGKCCHERPLDQIFLVLLGPALLGGLEARVQCRHYLSMMRVNTEHYYGERQID